MSVAIIKSIITAAQVVGLPPALLLSICYTESNYRNVVTPHDGHSASYGVCQVKHATAALMAKKHKLRRVDPSHLMSPEMNALVAGLYLKHQLARYDGSTPCAIEAYNRGTAGKCQSSYVKKVLTRCYKTDGKNGCAHVRPKK